ncbi:MAG: molybdopterin synthase catalytic subunit [Thermococcaceae archaeon]|nr:molybdopterin synthase catalytic subunit [Thermococcaceae archaeon]MDK2913229.1 molybdopterin synthase catalytic subunit [Thermococcaceae archaeon]
MKVMVTQESFDVNRAIELISNPESGAYVVFLGKVRAHNRGRKVERLIYEVYGEMAVSEMAKIREEALRKFPIFDAVIWHRYGDLPVGEDTILVVVSSAHRKEAFEACSWIVDEVKRRVPVWKKEVTEEGEFWIEGDRVVRG